VVPCSPPPLAILLRCQIRPWRPWRPHQSLSPIRTGSRCRCRLVPCRARAAVHHGEPAITAWTVLLVVAVNASHAPASSRPCPCFAPSPACQQGARDVEDDDVLLCLAAAAVARDVNRRFFLLTHWLEILAEGAGEVVHDDGRRSAVDMASFQGSLDANRSACVLVYPDTVPGTRPCWPPRRPCSCQRGGQC
jgi:hypothetical protein